MAELEKGTKAVAASSDSEHDAVPYTGVVDEKEFGHVRRGLKARHVQFIAIGGIIGTGLFVGSGAALVRAGPLSLLLAYSIVGTVVYSLMCAIGEMTTWLPIPGNFTIYANRYLGDTWGFAMGWNYAVGSCITVCAECSAGLLLLNFWGFSSHIPPAAWVTLFLGVVFLLNIFVVEGYGEGEFVFASIKIITIICLLFLAVVLFFGGGPTHDRIGFRYWKDPGVMNTYLVHSDADLGRFLGFLKSFVNAVFAYGGSEIICIAASETLNPRINIPKAVRRTFWRILIFYVFGIFAIGVLVPFNDKGLTAALKKGSHNAAASPWVAAIVNAKISGLPHVINFVILTSAWSCANSYMYAASRSFYALAISGQAPSILAKCTKRGIPIYSVLLTMALSCLAYLLAGGNSTATVFDWFMNLNTVSGLFTWMTLFLSTIRFRKAYLAQGVTRDQLPFQSPIMPYAAYYGFAMAVFFIFASGFDTFWNIGTGKFVQSFFLIYTGVLTYMVPWIFYKIWKRGPFLKKPEEIDIWTGKEEVDTYERENPPPKPRNTLEKIWAKIV